MNLLSNPAFRDFRVRLYFYLVYAFMGKIDFRIRGIHIEYKDINNTKIDCYFDGEVTEIDLDEISEVETEIVCQFCSPYNEVNLWFEVIRLDSPDPLPCNLSQDWFYRRKEL
jgi:hypothetical protein